MPWIRTRWSRAYLSTRDSLKQIAPYPYGPAKAKELLVKAGRFEAQLLIESGAAKNRNAAIL